MRNYKIDNLKGILIFLVVLGHLLEKSLSYGINRQIYILIYSFHMPLFVYTTGYFAKFNLGRVVRNLLYPYLIFQTLYLLFDRFILGNKVVFQYTTPYWILWYMAAVIVWTMLLPLVCAKGRNKVVIIIAACIIALLAGYVDSIGRFLSLSRIFVFFPFFLLGQFSREWKIGNSHRLLVPTVILSVISIAYCVIESNTLKITWFYEANSYAKGNYQITFRIIHMAIAAVFIVLAMLLISNKRIPFLSRIGENTMPIYLMHGFIIKLIGKYEIIQSASCQSAVAVILTILLVLLLQSKPVLLCSSPFLRWNAWKHK